MKNLNLIPKKYTYIESKIKKSEIEKVISKYFKDMKLIGSAMSSLNIIPIIKDEQDPKYYRTSGNIGIKLDEIPGFLITGTEIDKANLNKKGVVYIEKVNYDKKIIYFHGSLRPSREVLIHERIYDKFSDVKIVLHTHDYLILKYGKIPITKRVSFAATLSHAIETVNLLKKGNCINLKNHGQIIKGNTIEEILDIISNQHGEALNNFRKNFSLPNIK